MTIEKVEGFKLDNEILLEDDLNNRGIISIKDYIKDYIDKYGFKVKSVYDYNNDLVVITCNNTDYLKKYGVSTTSFIYNYKTGEVIDKIPLKNENETDTIHKVEIHDKDNKAFVVIDNNVLLLKDELNIISNSLISYRENGIYYIFNIEEKKSYPITYLINFISKEPFNVCINNGDFTKVIRELNNESINYLISNYNFVMPMNHNIALKLDSSFGIKVSDLETNLYWYNNLDERNQKYDSVKLNCLVALKDDKAKSI